jgi:hypothetical protein
LRVYSLIEGDDSELTIALITPIVDSSLIARLYMCRLFIVTAQLPRCACNLVGVSQRVLVDDVRVANLPVVYDALFGRREDNGKQGMGLVGGK